MHSLEGKTIDLAQTQRDIIKEILDERRKAGVIKSDYEYEAQEQHMTSKIVEGEPLLKVREQKGTTDAVAYNQSFEELMYDLRTVFSQVNQVEETINKHQRLNQSLINTIQLRIKKVDEDLTKHERVANLYDSHQVYIENFIDPNGVELDQSYYTERDGTVLPSVFHAKLDIIREAIKLPTVINENSLIGPSGVQLGRLSIVKQLGTGYNRVVNPTTTLDKAIDNSDETFWGESLLVDAPIHVPLGKEYYDINFGAVCEIEVRFDYLTQLNELTFHTYGQYPLDIVAVRYFETDNTDEEPQTVIPPEQTRTVQGATSYQFSDIYAKRLRILFNQRHFVKSDFIASRKNQKNLEMIFQAAAEYSAEDEVIEEEIFSPVIRDKSEKDPTWGIFRKAIKGAEPDIDKIVESVSKDETRAISKYEYSYGLYNLGIYRNEYQQYGIHVSREIPVAGNVKVVTLSTIEEHPKPIPGAVFTDIEYYIYSGKEWFPILPQNISRIYSERLFPSLIGGKYKAYTRFEIASDGVVMKNGIRVSATISNKREVLINDYDATAIYTIAYNPTPDSHEIDFLELVPPKSLIEEFRGTNSRGVVNLSYYPYLDKTKLNAQPDNYDANYLENETEGYLPIKIKLVDKDGYHINQPTSAGEVGVRVDNVTDYFNPDVSHLENYDEANDVWYQYRVVDNTIQFNKPIPDDTKIIVEYPHLVGHIRVKAILRRNTHSFYGLTPILHQYVTNFQTLR